MNDDHQFEQQCQSELVYSEDVPERSDISSGLSSAGAGISKPPNPSSVTRYGFVLTVDNPDQNVRPNFQRENKGTKSYHFTHSYAVQTRVDLNGLSDDAPGVELSLEKILPSKEDIEELKKEFGNFIARF